MVARLPAWSIAVTTSFTRTSRATVSRVLAEEERRGTIAKRRRSIELIDVEELSRWARWPDDLS